MPPRSPRRWRPDPRAPQGRAWPGWRVALPAAGWLPGSATSAGRRGGILPKHGRPSARFGWPTAGESVAHEADGRDQLPRPRPEVPSRLQRQGHLFALSLDRPLWWMPHPDMLEAILAEPETIPYGYKEPDWRQWWPGYEPGKQVAWPWRDDSYTLPKRPPQYLPR